MRDHAKSKAMPLRNDLSTMTTSDQVVELRRESADLLELFSMRQILHTSLYLRLLKRNWINSNKLMSHCSSGHQTDAQYMRTGNT